MPESDQKQKTVALILCVIGFITVGGLHRFYTGHIGTGVLQLLTGGGCLIWQIIDLIAIAGGKFKDAQGQPLKE
jgi:TM2 domain-containing membrane protein YozV